MISASQGLYIVSPQRNLVERSVILKFKNVAGYCWPNVCVCEINLYYAVVAAETHVYYIHN